MYRPLDIVQVGSSNTRCRVNGSIPDGTFADYFFRFLHCRSSTRNTNFRAYCRALIVHDVACNLSLAQGQAVLVPAQATAQTTISRLRKLSDMESEQYEDSRLR